MLRPTSSALVALTYDLYEASSNYVIAFIFGHEFSHGFGRCAADKASALERNGQFMKLVDLQARGDVLCPNPLYLDEVKADRCALRVVEELDQGMVEFKTRAKNPPEEQEALLNLLSYSRRTAIDSMFYYFEVGLQPGEERAEIALKQKINASEIQFSPGYLYNGLRGILFAETLRRRETRNQQLVGICDNAARDLVHSLNFAVMMCRLPIDGRAHIDQSGLIEPFTEYVPPGVAKAWQTHVWHDGGPENSFSCKLQQ